MVKSELVLRLAARYRHLVHKDAQIAVDLIVSALIDALGHGRRIELREFGSFKLRQRNARKARNPKTGDAVYVPAKPMIYFRPGMVLKQRILKGAESRPGINFSATNYGAVTARKEGSSIG